MDQHARRRRRRGRRRVVSARAGRNANLGVRPASQTRPTFRAESEARRFRFRTRASRAPVPRRRHARRGVSAAPRAYRGRVPANARGAYVRRLGSIRRGGSRSVALRGRATRESRDAGGRFPRRQPGGPTARLRRRFRRRRSTRRLVARVPRRGTDHRHPSQRRDRRLRRRRGRLSSRPAAAAAAQSDASGSRPFGFLGVTRPPWHTRWEAHLEVSADAEPGADASESIRANPRTASLAESTRVFLGAFDAKESAARAHDAAKLKLFGPPPACGALNFPAEEYLDALGETRVRLPGPCAAWCGTRTRVAQALEVQGRARHAGREVGGQAGTATTPYKVSKKIRKLFSFLFSFAPRGSTRAEARTKRERSANEARPLATANRRRVVVFFKNSPYTKKNRKSLPARARRIISRSTPPRRRTRRRSSATPTRSP